MIIIKNRTNQCSDLNLSEVKSLNFMLNNLHQSFKFEEIILNIV